MFDLTRPWHPFPEMGALQQEMNRLFQQHRAPGSPVTPSGPPINVWRGPEGVTVTVRLPGCSPDDVDITTTGKALVIRGQRHPVEVAEGQICQRDESGSGNFVRTIELPFEIDTNKTEATFERGILTIALARTEKEQPQKIRIRSA